MMPKASTTSAVIEAVIDAIGARGDGIAETPAGRLYVPFAAPGDHLHVRIGAPRGDGHEARIEQVLAPGPERIEAVCRHFGICGGCALQHLRGEAIAVIKRDLLRTALSRRGLGEAPVLPTVNVPPGRRRRARFTVRRAGRTILGFSERSSHRVFDMGECPALRPEITVFIAPLREFCASLDTLGRAADVQVTLIDKGLDLLFIPARSTGPNLAAREAIAGFAQAHDLCRVTWESASVIEPIAARRPATVRFGDAEVALPPGAFLQPSEEGEAAIVDIVTRAVAEAGAKTVADFYAGCGALTFPLSHAATVHASEGSAAMVSALAQAARGRPITAKQRDIARNPPSPAELDRYGAVVFDPPRAGARALAEALARSRVPRIIAVSCNPATLARDLRILVDGGYGIRSVVPIDQFVWSAHVETVAVLDR